MLSVYLKKYIDTFIRKKKIKTNYIDRLLICGRPVDRVQPLFYGRSNYILLVVHIIMNNKK